ncbi:hypothetical protein J6590_100509 [Homalodisca vitripennis]|nr:hypothetical protein J6590_100509 [Homalodisca vitripennis]
MNGPAYQNSLMEDETCRLRVMSLGLRQLLGERAIYFDTDSITYTQKPEKPTVEKGECLCDMANELQKFGRYALILDEFFSGK